KDGARGFMLTPLTLLAPLTPLHFAQKKSAARRMCAPRGEMCSGGVQRGIRRGVPGPRVVAHGKRQRLQAVRILAGGNHRHGKRRLADLAVEVLLREPGAEARIANLRRAVPEVRCEPALDLQMVELELDDGSVF